MVVVCSLLDQLRRIQFCMIFRGLRQVEEKTTLQRISDAARLLVDFCESYSPHFIGWAMNSVGHARHYLSGLLGTQRRKNIEVIGEDVKGSDYQGMEQFISSSTRDHRAVMDQVAFVGDGITIWRWWPWHFCSPRNCAQPSGDLPHC